ncbi:MAG TPA: anti-sigma factor [Candidatus Dormibacteraeota bacterium]|nr:anti-sigma factor [Candidatus Dormibacteraeota bacterium]
MTCQEADVLLACWSVSGVEANEHRALRRHLAGCPDCRASAAAYRRAADLLPLAVDDVEPPPGLRSRVLAAVHAEAGAPRPANTAGRARESWWSGLWRRVPSGRAVTAVAGLAATAAVAVAVVAFVTRPAPAPAAPEAVVVRACGLAPPAPCGTLRYDPAAQQAVVTVTGLPAVPVVGGAPRSSYELWTVRADGSVSAAGFLTQVPGGSTYTAAMTGDMTGVVAVATTQEAYGGGPAPKGPEVLRLDLTGAG